MSNQKLVFIQEWSYCILEKVVCSVKSSSSNKSLLKSICYPLKSTLTMFTTSDLCSALNYDFTCVVPTKVYFFENEMKVV